MKIKYAMYLMLGVSVALWGSFGYAQNTPQAGSTPQGQVQTQSSSQSSNPRGPYYDDWDPVTEMKRVQDRMEKLFRNIMGDQMATFPKTGRDPLDAITYSPDLDMIETKDLYRIDLDLPGMEKDQIDISVKNQVLSVSGERKNDADVQQQADQGSYQYRGRSFGAFHHTLELPENADADRIDAKYDNGVLTIKIPKKEPAKEEPAKKIKIS